MKTKSRKSFIILFALMMLSGLLLSAPLSAYAAEAQFLVTENPADSSYTRNETAAPLQATFEYDSRCGLGRVDSSSTIVVKWYWSKDNSTTNRTNKCGDSGVVPYNYQITYQTKLTPPTDTVGIRYYYAVIIYAEARMTPSFNVDRIPREAVTRPAMIEVIDPDESVVSPTENKEHGFMVRKVDENGNP